MQNYNRRSDGQELNMSLMDALIALAVVILSRLAFMHFTKYRPQKVERRRGNKMADATASFPVWKTIQIGGMSWRKLLKDLNKNGAMICDGAKYMMARSDFVTEPTSRVIDLVRVSVRDLGFTDPSTIEEIFARGEELGLELCPAEVGPHLRRAYADQQNESLLIAMESIRCFQAFSIFELANFGLVDHRLSDLEAPLGQLMDLSWVFVFAQPRKAA